MTSFDSSSQPGRRSAVPRTLAAGLQLPSLVVGILLGLGLGLLIGWWLWPVEWQNALLQDLNPEARANYLAAVAEAYVYYQDEEAAALARQRLLDLNDNLAEEIAQAQAYFREHPQEYSRVHIDNLARLAAQLGVSTAAEAGAPDTTLAAVPPPASEGIPTWLNWLLVTLAAVVLLGGGLYLLRRVASQGGPNAGAGLDELEAEGEDAFEAEEMDEAEESEERLPRPITPGSARHASRRSRSPAGEDEYGFEAELDDADTLGRAGYPLEDEAYFGDTLDDTLDQGNAAESDIRYVDLTETGRTGAWGPAGSVTLPGELAEDLEDEDAEAAEEEDEDWDDLAPPPPSPVVREERPGYGLTSTPTPTPRPTTRPSTRLEKVAEFTARYQLGDLDYDQAFNIAAPEDGTRYIGECGMGVNLKNGILQNNPENVIALDVWLFDKASDKSPTTQTRVLISEYVIDHRLADIFTPEGQEGPAPIVAQPGLQFQLKGPALLLDCVVEEASYVQQGETKGIFKNVLLRLTVYRHA